MSFHDVATAAHAAQWPRTAPARDAAAEAARHLLEMQDARLR